MDKRTQFLKIYANLPLGSREEIEQNTPKGREILDILTKLKILP